MTYATRKDQCNAMVAEFAFEAELDLTRGQRAILRKLLRDACMIGACEERHHCLRLIAEDRGPGLSNRITKTPVLKVLGYKP